jgi:hypothetical protein
MDPVLGFFPSRIRMRIQGPKKHWISDPDPEALTLQRLHFAKRRPFHVQGWRGKFGASSESDQSQQRGQSRDRPRQKVRAWQGNVPVSVHQK